MTETPTNCRLGRRVCDPRDTAEFIHCLARHSHVSSARLSSEANLRHDAFLRQTDGTPGAPCKTSVALLTFLTNRTRDHRAIAALARDCGGVFVALPPDECQQGKEDVHQAVLRAVQEFGQDSGLIGRVLADGVVTEDEALAVDREIDETITALLRLKLSVRDHVAPRLVPVAAAAARWADEVRI